MSVTQADVDAHFEKAAQTYEETFPVMADFAKHALTLVPPMDSDSIVHDNACGPGIVSEAILRAHAGRPGAPPRIHATDLSPAMIRVLEAKPSLKHVVTAATMDATASTFVDDTFTHSFTNFGIMFLSAADAAKVTGHLYRSLRSGGTAEVATWARLGYMDLYADVVRAIKPAEVVPPGGLLPAVWMEKATLVQALVDGGFAREKIHVISQATSLSGSLFGAEGAQTMTAMLKKQVTKGWSETDAKVFEEKMAERLKEDTRSGKTYEMVAWMAVAKKS